jgi:hypothetical protein
VGLLIAPVSGHGTQSVANGLIHDWIGAVFIPNATLVCTESDQSFSMVWQHRRFLMAAALLIAIATVYGRHHYAADAASGFLMAVLALAAAR